MKLEFAIAVLIGVLSWDCVLSGEATIEKRLMQLRSHLQSPEDAEEAEAKALALIHRDSSLEDCGEVCAMIALMYSDKGIVRPDKVIEYGEKALAFPISETTSCLVRVRIISGKLDKLERLKGPALLAAQKEIVMLCIQGVALATKNLDSFSRVKLPVVGMYVISGPENDPAFRARRDRIEREHDLQLAARRAAEMQNQSIMLLETLTGQCGLVFKESNVGEEELRRTAKNAGCSEKAIDYMLEKLAYPGMKK